MTLARSVLIVSPHFPPSSLAGVHRARHLAKHLPAHGWWPTVIRVDESHYTETNDPLLASLVPGSVEQVRTGAIPARLARVLGVGDVGLRGYAAIRRAIAESMARVRADVVLITGSPYYPMLLSRWIGQSFGVPVVLDFQDPWVSAEGAARPRWSKGGVSHRLAATLEPQAMRHADFVTSVSEVQNDEMAARYPWFDRRRMASIPIGGDPDDFAALRRSQPDSRHVRLDPEKINISYVGTYLPRAEPLMRVLLRAAASLQSSHPEVAGRLRFNFVGTSNQPDSRDAFAVRPIAEQEGVAALVAETPQRIPYIEALGLLANSHGLLLIGSDEPHYTASKIYPALMSGRPYLSLFHRKSSAHAILTAAGGGRAFSFDRPAELAALVVPLAAALAELAISPERLGTPDPAGFEQYTAHHIAGQFADVFERVQRREAA